MKVFCNYKKDKKLSLHALLIMLTGLKDILQLFLKMLLLHLRLNYLTSNLQTEQILTQLKDPYIWKIWKRVKTNDKTNHYKETKNHLSTRTFLKVRNPMIFKVRLLSWTISIMIQSPRTIKTRQVRLIFKVYFLFKRFFIKFKNIG